MLCWGYGRCGRHLLFLHGHTSKPLSDEGGTENFASDHNDCIWTAEHPAQGDRRNVLHS